MLPQFFALNAMAFTAEPETRYNTHYDALENNTHTLFATFTALARVFWQEDLSKIQQGHREFAETLYSLIALRPMDQSVSGILMVLKQVYNK